MSDLGKEHSASANPSANEAAVDRSSADIGIVCTHKGEIRPFLKRLDRQRSYSDRRMTMRGGFLGESTRVAIAEAGIGFAAHRAATELLITEHHPAWVLAVGFSSSLSEVVQPGDLCIGNEICDTHVSTLPVKCTISASKRIHVGRLIVADKQPATPEAKAVLKERFPGLAVDTNSLAAAQVCSERSVRFIAVRVIVDGLTEQMPEQAVSMIFKPDSRAVGSALGTFFKGFRKMSDMNVWRERSATAAINLDRFISGIAMQIADKLQR